jgi:glutamate racemase
VEEGLWEDPVTEEIARRYLAEMMDEGIDTLILGCTHYPLIRKTLAKVVGDRVRLVNPAYETAKELEQMLESRGLLAEERPALGSADSQYSFFVSDMADKFQQFANSIIKYGILSAKTINIEEY